MRTIDSTIFEILEKDEQLKTKVLAEHTKILFLNFIEDLIASGYLQRSDVSDFLKDIVKDIKTQ